MPLVLDDDYPELFALLATAAEAAFAPLCAQAGLTDPAEAAADLAFELAEYARSRLGGTTFRLLAYREQAGADLFGAAPLERPDREPAVRWTTEGGNNVDLIAFVHAAAVWLLATRLPATTIEAINPAAAALCQRFHHDADGRDQTYIPKGQGFDIKAKYRRLWDQFTGHNYAQLALQEGLTEMRIRQIITAVRTAETRRRQSQLFPPA